MKKPEQEMNSRNERLFQEGTAPTEDDTEVPSEVRQYEQPKKAYPDQRLKLNLEGITARQIILLSPSSSKKQLDSQRTVGSQQVSDHQIYQGYKDFLSASEGAVGKLGSVQQGLTKKIEAKKIEGQQVRETIDLLLKENTDLSRFIDIYTQRNTTLLDNINTLQ